MRRFHIVLVALIVVLASLAGQIIWGEAIVWGTLGDDHIIWGTLGRDAIVWGS